MKSVKKLYFYPDFFFLQIKCYFFITPTEFECLHFEIIKSVYSKPLTTVFRVSILKKNYYYLDFLEKKHLEFRSLPTIKFAAAQTAPLTNPPPSRKKIPR